jgi:hypothetical protein
MASSSTRPGARPSSTNEPVRTVAESTKLLDRIVGRCVRDAAFAEWVLADPEAALVQYEVNSGELADFRALKAQQAESAARQWALMRTRWSPTFV